jgi:endoglucanase
VYLADDRALDAPVALKVLGDHHSAVPDLRERFVNEARILRRLGSDRIVTVFDIGEWKGQPYVVMEALIAGTLADRLQAVRPSRDDVVRLVTELGDCLRSAHAGGVIHRDIKPSNLLIRSTGPVESLTDRSDSTELIAADERLVLADFGLARFIGASGITVAGGTDGFMAPEQRTPSATLDERADIFAATAVVAMALKGSISDEVVAELPSSTDPVDRALARGLAELPSDRYADATSWADALIEALGPDDDAAHPTKTVAADAASHASAPARPGSPRRWSTALVAAGAIVAVAAVLFTAVSLFGDDSQPAAESIVSTTVGGQLDTSASEAVSVALTDGWSTQGSRIVDSLGRSIEVRGVSWFGFGGDSLVVDGLWARNWRDLVELIAELGFNTIRLPLSSATLDAGAVPTNIDPALNPDLVGLTSLEVLDRIVDYAAEVGLAVVLERHTLASAQTSALWYDESRPAERFIADWEQLAERYADSPNVVGADLADAPTGAACWGCGNEATDWQLAAERAGTPIHRIAPEWLIFVAGVEQLDGAGCGVEGARSCAAWGADLGGALTAPVQLAADSADKVVYTSQEFGPSVFRQAWFDDPTFPANMPALWDTWWGELELADAAPVVLDTIGTSFDNDIDRAWLDALLAHADKRDTGFAYWSLNPNTDGTGLLGEDWNTVDEAKMAVLRPYLSGPFE